MEETLIVDQCFLMDQNEDRNNCVSDLALGTGDYTIEHGFVLVK